MCLISVHHLALTLLGLVVAENLPAEPTSGPGICARGGRRYCCPGWVIVERTKTCIRTGVHSKEWSCEELDCQHVCAETRGHRAYCACRPGYQLVRNRLCEDVNECRDGVCSQLCVNHEGGFECRCYQGFHLLSDNRTCWKNTNKTSSVETSDLVRPSPARRISGRRRERLGMIYDRMSGNRPTGSGGNEDKSTSILSRRPRSSTVYTDYIHYGDGSPHDGNFNPVFSRARDGVEDSSKRGRDSRNGNPALARRRQLGARYDSSAAASRRRIANTGTSNIPVNNVNGNLHSGWSASSRRSRQRRLDESRPLSRRQRSIREDSRNTNRPANPFSGNFHPIYEVDLPTPMLRRPTRRLQHEFRPRSRRDSRNTNGPASPFNGNFHPSWVVRAPSVSLPQPTHIPLRGQRSTRRNSRNPNEPASPYTGNFHHIMKGEHPDVAKPEDRVRQVRLQNEFRPLSRGQRSTHRSNRNTNGPASPFNGNFHPNWVLDVPSVSLPRPRRPHRPRFRGQRSTRRNSRNTNDPASPFTGYFHTLLSTDPVPSVLRQEDRHGRVRLQPQFSLLSRQQRSSNGNGILGGNFHPIFIGSDDYSGRNSSVEQLRVRRAMLSDEPAPASRRRTGRARVGLGGTVTWQEGQNSGQGSSGYVHTYGGKHVASTRPGSRQVSIASSYTSDGNVVYEHTSYGRHVASDRRRKSSSYGIDSASDQVNLPVDGSETKIVEPELDSADSNLGLSPNPELDTTVDSDDGAYIHTQAGRHVARTSSHGANVHTAARTTEFDVDGGKADLSSTVRSGTSGRTRPNGDYLHLRNGRHVPQSQGSVSRYSSNSRNSVAIEDDENTDVSNVDVNEDNPEPYGTYVHSRDGYHIALGVNRPGQDGPDYSSLRPYPDNYFHNVDIGRRNNKRGDDRVNGVTDLLVDNFNSGPYVGDHQPLLVDQHHRALQQPAPFNGPSISDRNTHGSHDNVLIADLGSTELRARLVHQREGDVPAQNNWRQRDLPSSVGTAPVTQTDSENLHASVSDRQASANLVASREIEDDNAIDAGVNTDDWRLTGLSDLERSLGVSQVDTEGYYGYENPCRLNQRSRPLRCYKQGKPIACPECVDSQPRRGNAELDSSTGEYNPYNDPANGAYDGGRVVNPCYGCNQPVYFSTRGCQARSGPGSWNGAYRQWRQPIGPLMPSSFCDQYRRCCMTGGQGRPVGQGHTADVGGTVYGQRGSDDDDEDERSTSDDDGELTSALTVDGEDVYPLPADGARPSRSDGNRAQWMTSDEGPSQMSSSTRPEDGATISRCPRDQQLIKDDRGWRCQAATKPRPQIGPHQIRNFRNDYVGGEENVAPSRDERRQYELPRRQQDDRRRSRNAWPKPRPPVREDNQPVDSAAWKQNVGRAEDESECSSRCMNGGRCQRGVCVCPVTFTGQYCQTDVDECSTSEHGCEYGCRNVYGGYVCTCPDNARISADGRRCDVLPCNLPCRNGGVCMNGRCSCPSGFYGRLCEKDVNECLRSTPCSHECVNTFGSFTCSCPVGLTLTSDLRTCVPEE